MEYVYGPVPSRRLGRSLGIDPIPTKTCNWNCVYCQLGRTRRLVTARAEYVPTSAILAEVEQALAANMAGQIDWVTFVGSGEPTLHSELGRLIRRVKELTSVPVAVITNGSLLSRPEVQEELSAADAVLPTLDAGNETLYRRINRPHPQFSFERLIDGLTSFRAAYRGRMWVEVMLLQGLNDTEAALRELAEVLRSIRPDQIHLTLPVRPPAEAWVRPADMDGVQRALALLGQTACMVPHSGDRLALNNTPDAVQALAQIIRRHPVREAEAQRALESALPGNINVHAALTAAGCRLVECHGQRFWRATDAEVAGKN